jgi:hypothetical protein
MKQQPMILHIDLGNQSLTNWLRDNKYVVYSELVRFCEKMIRVKQFPDLIRAKMPRNILSYKDTKISTLNCNFISN